MQVHYGLESFPKLNFAVVTSGTFDGVHIGHQKILSRLKEIALENAGETVLITFFPHPRLVLSKGKSEIKLLTTLEEKIQLLRNQGIDHFIVLPFTEKFSQMSPEDYVRDIYVNAIQTSYLVIGYDHKFGKDRAGGLEYLQANKAQFHFELEEIRRQDIDEVGVSSTKIRNALLEGNISTANQYLGYPFSISGKVVHGDKIGRTIGYPTANIQINEDYKLIPADGIYAVQCEIQQKKFNGMLYIGNRPTLEGLDLQRIEVNLFDFDANIYDENVRVEFIAKIRNDMKFSDLASLKHQMQKDKIAAQAFLTKLA